MTLRTVVFLWIIFICNTNAQDNVNALEPIQIAKTMQRVADWQIHNFREVYSGRKKPHHIRNWTNGALYVGMLKWASISGDSRYQEWLKSIAEKGEWSLHWRPYHADDHVIGQLYLDLYRRYNDSEMLSKTKKSLDHIMANPSNQPITLDNYKHLERWTWCDALFMSPPVWAKMTKISGEQKYLDWMMKEFIATTDHLYDHEESLYYRDNSYIGKLVDDHKVFWARGNGWVYAGLTLIMDELDPDSDYFSYFKEIYLEMSIKLLELQLDAGHWSMSYLSCANKKIRSIRKSYGIQ